MSKILSSKLGIGQSSHPYQLLVTWPMSHRGKTETEGKDSARKAESNYSPGWMLCQNL